MGPMGPTLTYLVTVCFPPGSGQAPLTDVETFHGHADVVAKGPHEPFGYATPSSPAHPTTDKTEGSGEAPLFRLGSGAFLAPLPVIIRRILMVHLDLHYASSLPCFRRPEPLFPWHIVQLVLVLKYEDSLCPPQTYSMSSRLHYRHPI